MSNYINGLRTVNGGEIIEVNGMEVEVLRHESHNPNCDIVCTYYRENGKKVKVTFSQDYVHHTMASEVCLFKHDNDLQHYRSYHYELSDIPFKYQELVLTLKIIHENVFGESVKMG